MTEASIQLPDKRKLAYVLWGPADGEPVLYFHGTPSSRLEPSLLYAYNINLEELLLKYKVRLISIDRPGIGLSTFNANGNFVSFAEDVQVLAQRLEINNCKVMAWSGGGPFALAIAHRFPSLITRIHIIAGFTRSFSEPGVFRKMHGNKLYFGAAKYIPSIAQFILRIALRKKPKIGIPQIISRLADVDHQLLSEIDKVQQLAKVTTMEAVRISSKGAVYEAGLYFKDVGYKLHKIKQPVHYYWGNEDKAVIHLHRDALTQQVPAATIHFKPNEGHLSIYINYFEEALRTLKGQI
jgi:pimeloyl-ACP methyl ester carboxylesterase